jgi:hypothetical protein
VIQPFYPKDVSVILGALADANQDVHFAVKGGGHTAVPGFNSTNGGILVDMKLFTDVKYDQSTTLVDVGPGLTWDEVYAALKPYGVNVAGATTCPGVGVAGFNLGGGYGNKTNQYGLAIDNIVAIEVVLPDGTIVQANAQSYNDVFWALRGGGNNFGVVTKWTLSTHPQGPIYSAIYNYQHQYFDQVVAAIIVFSKREVQKSNVEAVFEYTRDNDEVETVASVECFYDGETPPAMLFKEFEDIPHLWTRLDKSWEDRQKNLPRNRQTYRVGRPGGEDDLPAHFRGRFSSVMVSHYDEALIQAAIKQTGHYAEGFVPQNGLQIYVDIWPFLPSIFDNSPSCAWPHTKGHPSGPLVINFKWQDEANDQDWLTAIGKMTDHLRTVAQVQSCTTPDAADYSNLSLDNVTTFDIYRGNLEQLIPLRKKYDPKKVMNRTGGFRIPSA